MALDGLVDGIVTAPISKKALHLSGHTQWPGHTEMLADLCGVARTAMMLYLPPRCEAVRSPCGLGVIHTTLHTSMRNAINALSVDSILETAELATGFARRMLAAAGETREPRVGVAALNPHAGEEGMFGDEEIRIIRPAVEAGINRGLPLFGPLPCDTLMHRAADGEFDCIVAMYHDQGHIALKLIGLHQAVNVTLGLPIVRTSVAHGTAFDIAGKGIARSGSMAEATLLAGQLARLRAKA
jgi:4-hydroxythreonine-4-phosphate dehydrogenase